MTTLGWVALSLSTTICLLLGKLLLIRRGMKDLAKGLKEKMEEETNTPISVSVRDKWVLALSDALNEDLSELIKKRHDYEKGSANLRNSITNLSHDIRTPLTAIRSYVDLLEREEDLDKKEKYLSIIKERIILLTNLTDELFRYSTALNSPKDPKPETVVLNEALENCIAAEYEALCEKNITPEINLPEKRITRTLDKRFLERILSNLLSNARKYSKGDLKIELTEKGEITFSNRAPDLDAVQVGRLFDRYYTVQTGKESTGLGLSIARTLTEKMGGTLQAEFKNEELCFRLFFPA